MRQTRPGLVGLDGKHAREPARAVELTPLELNVCQVRHRCGEGPPQPDAALVVRSSRGRSIQFDANIGLRHTLPAGARKWNCRNKG